jgi:class 3 adenylate cyclase
MTATELVKKLDVYFTKFDKIIVKNNLEKIKTIGDAYMCAGGVPVRNNTNPIDTCVAALQIQAYMNKRKNDAIANDGEYWELRLGINTGEVTAGKPSTANGNDGRTRRGNGFWSYLSTHRTLF